MEFNTDEITQIVLAVDTFLEIAIDADKYYPEMIELARRFEKELR